MRPGPTSITVPRLQLPNGQRPLLYETVASAPRSFFLTLEDDATLRHFLGFRLLNDDAIQQRA